MTKKPVFVNANDSVAYAIRLMHSNATHSVLIQPNKREASWQIFTESDFLPALASGKDPEEILVSEYATPVNFTAHPDWTVKKAKSAMIELGVVTLPVFDGGKFIGVITSRELLLAGDQTTDAPPPDSKVRKKRKGK